MGLLTWLARKSARNVTAARHVSRVVRGRYDAAATNDDNRRHWANADALSARSANSAAVRLLLRNRARYEIANNSYARGMTLTLANDLIGTGPRLQLLTSNEAANRNLEAAFHHWAKSIGLAEKLRTMRMARASDGEAFALLTNNRKSTLPIKLDVHLVEADQITTPDLDPMDLQAVDGIRFDADGNPAEYHMLDQHPGDMGGAGLLDYRVLSPSQILHWFRADRPGQARGIPDITPAIPLFAQLRRYTLAVIAAAETAADFAAVLQTNSPASGEADAAEPFEAIEIDRRMMTTLPAGWQMGQFKSEQPATTYGDFKREILNEIARCLNMPFNVAAGNSSGYNYSSGRLDHQVYYKSIRVDQAHIANVVLDAILTAWLDEAVLAGLMPDNLGPLVEWPHQWFWDGQEHVDPAKEATAQATRLTNHTTTLADEFARRGQDWETQLRQRARELALMTALGIPQPTSAPSTPTPAPTPLDEADEENGPPAD